MRLKTFRSLVSVSVPLMSDIPLSVDVNPNELSDIFRKFFDDYSHWIGKLKNCSIEVLLWALREHESIDKVGTHLVGKTDGEFE